MTDRPLSPFALVRRIAIAFLILGVLLPRPVEAQSRIKDIADFEGVRDNMLVGYGLVVGLNGTGDSLQNSVFTKESLVGMLERLGVNARNDSLRTKNIAAVMVTATLPPFARQGTRLDVVISTLGDASNLLGGTLLVTPLVGADAEVYAIAKGTVAVSGFTAQGQGQSITRGVPTAGRIANGAIIEREISFQLASLQTIRIALRNPDLTTARRIAQAINAYVGVPAARSTDPGTVTVQIPSNYQNDVVGLLTDIEQLRVAPDQVAKVVIDEQSGTIVMGENVRIATVAIAHGNLTIRITETPQVSQPEAFSTGGTTTVVPRTQIDVDSGEGKKFGVMRAGVTLQELVDGLNALGVSPRDMISILQSIKAAGALQAEIVLM